MTCRIEQSAIREFKLAQCGSTCALYKIDSWAKADSVSIEDGLTLVKLLLSMAISEVNSSMLVNTTKHSMS